MDIPPRASWHLGQLDGRLLGRQGGSQQKPGQGQEIHNKNHPIHIAGARGYWFENSIHHQCLLERKMEMDGRDQVTNMPLALSEKNTKNNTEGHGWAHFKMSRIWKLSSQSWVCPHHDEVSQRDITRYIPIYVQVDAFVSIPFWAFFLILFY